MTEKKTDPGLTGGEIQPHAKNGMLNGQLTDEDKWADAVHEMLTRSVVVAFIKLTRKHGIMGSNKEIPFRYTTLCNSLSRKLRDIYVWFLRPSLAGKSFLWI